MSDMIDILGGALFITPGQSARVVERRAINGNREDDLLMLAGVGQATADAFTTVDALTYEVELGRWRLAAGNAIGCGVAGAVS